MYCIPSTVSLRGFVSPSLCFSSCLHAFVPPCLLFLAFCYLSPSALAQVQIVEGTWNWPDQGLNLWDPNGDTLGGAVVMDLLAVEGKLVVAADSTMPAASMQRTSPSGTVNHGRRLAASRQTEPSSQ